MKLIWSKRAQRDLEQIGDFISRDAPERARSFVQLLINRTNQASQLPAAGRIVPEFRDENLRELIEGRYRIVYEIDVTKKLVNVLTVFESHMQIRKLK